MKDFNQEKHHPYVQRAKEKAEKQKAAAAKAAEKTEDITYEEVVAQAVPAAKVEKEKLEQLDMFPEEKPQDPNEFPVTE